MPFVKFLEDYDGHFRGNIVDLRLSYARSLVAQNKATWAEDVDNSVIFNQGEPGYVPSPTALDVANNYVLQADGDWVANEAAGVMNFSQDVDGTVNGPTAGEISGNYILRSDNSWIDPTTVGPSAFSQDTDGIVNGPTAGDISGDYILRADNTWIDPTTVGFTGTQGSVLFVHTDGTITEDNDKFYFDDVNDELGINIGTSPSATLHIGRDVSTGDMFRAVRSGSGATAEAFYIGDGGAQADLLVTGDGRVGIGEAEATTNAQLRVRGNSNAAIVLIDNNATSVTVGLLIDHDTATADAVDVTADCTTANGLDVNASSLTTGRVAHFRSASSSTSARDLVEIGNNHASAVNAVPLRITSLAASALIRANYSSNDNDVAFGLDTTGHITTRADQTSDTAPNDDTSQKKLSLQRLATAPTNAAYIPFQQNPGGSTVFYLVLEEG